MRFLLKTLHPVLSASFALLGTLTIAQTPAETVQFKDITQQARINFQHHNGAAGKKFMPEMLGPGCAFIDYNDDGYPDILFIDGQDWSGQRSHVSTLKLYRNNGNGTFTDVTARAKLTDSMYGMGAAIGDYDNDGYDDIFVSALGQSHLFHNNGNGTFTNVTIRAGLGGINEFSTSAAWVDYDRNGKLDLVVVNYVQWTPKTDLFCTLDGSHKSYCTPEAYKGASIRLWHNMGNGRFKDVTKRAGLYDAASKGLGIAVLDYNNDKWPDLLIVNDTQPNKLYVNNRNETFRETAVTAGIAFSEDGVARAGMGVDVSDYDRSGRPSIIITNFSNQMISLYHNEGNGLFVDEAPRSSVGLSSLLTLGFACFFFDYDLDGWPDIFVANGHIDSDIERVQKRVKYRQPPHLFHNVGNGKFEEAIGAVGRELGLPRVARGAAYADIDYDGDLDLLLTTNSGPAFLFRNDGGNRNYALRIRLRGTESNSNGIGAVVRIENGTDRQWQMVHSGSSYLSQSELVLTFGLGQQTSVSTVQIDWPSGQVDKLTNVTADQSILVQEGKGIIAAKKFTKAPSNADEAPQRSRLSY